jgi:hypothetical protein
VIDDGVAQFLPSLARARALSFELPEGRPTIERPLAAVTVVARAQTRQVFDERMEISLALAEKLPRSAPKPSEAYEPATYRYFAHSAPERACSSCAFKPGFADCVACGASGRAGDQPFTTCSACDGVGWVRCTACNGTKRVLPARIRRVEDRTHALRHTFVPDVGEHLGNVVLLEAMEREPDSALAVHLDARSVIAPYRTADDVPRKVTFLDYDFEDTLERARTAVEGLTSKDTLVRCEVRAWVFPFLYLAWPSEDACVLVMRNGELVLLR